MSRALIFTGCVLLLFITSAPTAMGGNVVREVRETIKNARYEENNDAARKVANSLRDAEKKLMDAIADEPNSRKMAEMYFTSARVWQRFNNIENEKIYLNRNYDTVLFYNSIDQLYRRLEQCDSVERSSEHLYKIKYRKQCRKLMLNYRTNLLNGVKYYLKKKNYNDAYRLADTYLSSSRSSILLGDSLFLDSPMQQNVSYWAVSSAYETGNYNGVLKHYPEAVKYKKHEVWVKECQCRSYFALGDTLHWVESMKQGFMSFPEHDYFFDNLTAYLNNSNRHSEAIYYAGTMLKKYPTNPKYWYVEAYSYLLKEKYPQSVADWDKVVTLSPDNVDAHYYRGLSYCRMAQQTLEVLKKEKVGSENYRNKKAFITECFIQARPSLEKVRVSKPQDVSQWAPLLYQVYLNLNEGALFDEIDRIMRSQSTIK